MSKKINYNERSWAIDIIVEINLICSNLNLPIKRAGGEHTLRQKGESSLFPDVLLFGDENGTVVIQGWELKMPDTDITDSELIANAIKKAKRLSMDSFLLWNVNNAVLYTKNDDNFFTPSKNWTNNNIAERSDVFANKESWLNLLKIIIKELCSLLDKKYFKPTNIDTIIGDDLYSDILSLYSPRQQQTIKEAIRKDSTFELLLKDWFSENRDEYKGMDCIQAISQVIIINWINRFIFAHYLKLYTENAVIVESIKGQISINDAIDVFEVITKSSDFMNIFKKVLGIEYVHEELWLALLEINNLLCDLKFEAISQPLLINVIDNALSYSRKKVAGQFSTPPKLAEYLVGISVKDRTKHIIDVCCGTGTIIKAAYQLKIDKGISVDETFKTIWASDKFAFPLQLCSMALSDPRGMGKVVQVFQEDVLSLATNQTIEFIDPFTGNATNRVLPTFHAILSNLPFVRFEDAEKMNPYIEEARINLKESGFDLSSKADLYAYIVLTIEKLLEIEGRAGLIISNSWLGTDWGEKFREHLKKKYKISKIVISANSRWFQNADVVTVIIVLEKHLSVPLDYSIDFISTKHNIAQWDVDKMVAATMQNKIPYDCISKQTYSMKEISDLEYYGIGWNAHFVEHNWVNEIKALLTPLNTYFDVTRGERRGWDPMFYPTGNHQIEPEYIRPVIMSTKDLDGKLIAKADRDAFCCSDDISIIRLKGNTGALDWINKFKYDFNKKGKPLPEVLKRANINWYEMSDSNLADIILSMNPDKKLCFYKCEQPSFVNQRLVSFVIKKERHKLNLIHALMNSTISLFLLESIGFGRGLGVLDINTTKISKKMRILDPEKISEANSNKIVDAFNPLLKRNIMDITTELQQYDRINFDQAVLNAYQLNINVNEIYSSLLNLYNIRQNARL